MPFPQHRARASGGIIAANDSWPSEPHRRAAGGGDIVAGSTSGSFPISVTMNPGSYAGSPDVPHLTVGPINNSGAGGVQDYLNTVAAGAYHAPPPTAPAPASPAAAPDAPAPAPYDPMGNMAPGGVLTWDQYNGSPGTSEGGAGDSAGGADSDGGEGGGGSAGEGNRGGSIRGIVRHHRADSGPVPGYADDNDDSDADPTLSGLGGIAPGRLSGVPLPPGIDGDIPRPSGIAQAYHDAPQGPADRHDDAPNPDEPPPTIGADWTPRSAAAARAAPAHGDKSDLWRTLMYTGLGIMGGTSPHAAVNIGKGALAGLNMAEQAKLRETQQENNQIYRDQMNSTRLRGQDLRSQSSQANVDAKLQICSTARPTSRIKSGTVPAEPSRCPDASRGRYSANVAG